MHKSALKKIALITIILFPSLCFGNDTILIRNNKILDIQFKDDTLQIKDQDGAYSYHKFDWIQTRDFPSRLSCSFQETFDNKEIKDSISALGKIFYAISNTLIAGCSDYTLSNSFPSKIQSLSSYDKENILVGTASDGIFVCNGTQKQSLYIPHLALPKKIEQLKKLGDNIIINTGNSISFFNPSSLQLESLYASNYPVKFSFDALANIWIIDGNKLVCNSEFSNLDLLECSIKKMEADSEKITRESKIDFEYFTYYPKNQSKVEYAYSLDGGNWTTTKNESVRFEGLDPGKHTFRVKSSVDDIGFSAPSEKSFRVEATLKDSIWPIIFGLSGILFVGFLFALRRQINTTNKMQISRDKLQLENELLKSRQKVLELQMNPHFLFNTLNSIQGLIALKKNKEARQYLKEFSQMMRSILQSSREENISIAEELKFLTNYMSLEKMARNDKFDFTIDVDPEIDQDKKIPVMILQALLENAIIHGVSPMHGKGHIVLKLNEVKGRLGCKVMDDGVGMDYNKNVDTEHISYASDIIKDRLKKYNINDVVYTVPNSGTGVIAEVFLPYLK